MAGPTPSPADSPPAGAGRYRFGAFELATRTGELTRDGQPVKLQPQPARVLGLLVARAGEIVLREDLKAHLWGEDTFVDFERGLNFCILQVRTALRDTSENPRFVQTVPRRGYRFIAPVAFVADGQVRLKADPTLIQKAAPRSNQPSRTWGPASAGPSRRSRL